MQDSRFEKREWNQEISQKTIPSFSSFLFSSWDAYSLDLHYPRLPISRSIIVVLSNVSPPRLRYMKLFKSEGKRATLEIPPFIKLNPSDSILTV